MSISGLPGKDGAGTFDGSATFFTTSSGFDYLIFERLFWPGSTNTLNFSPITQVGAPQDGSSAVTGGPTSATQPWKPYVNGSFRRERSGTFATSSANGEFRGLLYTSNNATTPNSHSFGYKFVFTNPASFVKANTHTLELTFEVSWGRG